MTSLARAAAVIDQALGARAFSAAAAEVGRASGALWQHAGGRLAFDDPRLVTMDTVFDVASLTKVLATTTLAAEQVAAGDLDLDAPVSALSDYWREADRDSVTVRDLLEHASGLPAYRPYYLTLSGRAAYEMAIASEPLDYAPRTASLYSDLGFMLLGFILEDRAGSALDAQFDRWRSREGIIAPLSYRTTSPWADLTAYTENDPWRGRPLQGEVHDENAAALGGVAAHAGLFGTAAGVGQVARWWLSRLRGQAPATVTPVTPEIARRFVERSRVPGSSRALGWDTMLTRSSCGSHFSTHAVGHTGFTGTSLWIDPEQDLYAVLLTNRVHPTRANDAIKQVRRDFHDAVAGAGS
ncbi:MAG TPA: serine hydrolase domain-containing protein [Vicinamibacterales bacterium]|nr:serine hydrolase domain-containing protein [Vicinamibacterales bacterium]